MAKKTYKPKCKVGDLIIWRNDKGLIVDIKKEPELDSMFIDPYKGGTYYMVEWLEEQEDGSFLNMRERTPVEALDEAIKERIYDYYPVKNESG